MAIGCGDGHGCSDLSLMSWVSGVRCQVSAQPPAFGLFNRSKKLQDSAGTPMGILNIEQGMSKGKKRMRLHCRGNPPISDKLI